YLCQRLRKRAIKNLRIALGDQLDSRAVSVLVQKSLRNFSRGIVELGHALSATPEELQREIPVVGWEHMEKALAREKGVIAISAHLGNFFLVGARLSMQGYPTHFLVNPPKNTRFREFLVQLSLSIGQKTIHARPRRHAPSELLRVLRQNELAVVIADEHGARRGIRVQFFGRTVMARRGPATLALRSGAALVPVYLIRGQNSTLTLIVEPEIELQRSGDVNANIRENTLRITQWLERVVSSYPDQWNWMNFRWQEDLPGAVTGKENRYERVA
ncbi:MAG: lysophospholipid acyltransferase family protein, partial [Deltaproteobacteria bacterium]|nr:lysophospholipid acyltransferase family protein [Deltaproteobacteria bacterium]